MKRKAIILMNDMRGSAENQVEIDNGFPDRSAAIAFIRSHTVEPYKDEAAEDYYGNIHCYQKTFAKGSPLEWMNPLTEDEMQGDFRLEHGIVEIELEEVQRWRRVS